MRCGRCEHDNPKNTSHCEACGAPLGAAAGGAPLHPGRKLTGVAPAPLLPPTELPFTPAFVPPVPPPAAAPLAAPPGAPPFAAFTAGGQQERRTVAEPAPVLPPVHSAGLAGAPTHPAPQAPSLLAHGAPTQAAHPAPTQAAPGLPTHAAPTHAAPSAHGIPTPFAPAAPAPSMYTQAAPTAPSPGVQLPGAPPSPFGVALPVTSASPRLAAPPGAAALGPTPAPPPVAPGAPRVDPTQLVQAPSVGGAPQLRGALFEYRGLGHHGFIHTLRSGRNVIGRDPSVCDVIVEDDRISKQHAFLFIRGDEVAYLDISSNGSVVDGKLVHGTEVRLASPSVIELGGVRLVFVFAPRRMVDGLP